MTYLLCDCQLITCNHLNTNSKVKCPANGLSTIMSWRIKQGKQPTKCPRTSRTFFSLFQNLLICNPKRSQTLFSKLVNNGIDFSSNFFFFLATIQNLFKSFFTSPNPVSNCSTLVHGIKRQKMHFYDVCACLLFELTSITLHFSQVTSLAYWNQQPSRESQLHVNRFDRKFCHYCCPNIDFVQWLIIPNFKVLLVPSKSHFECQDGCVKIGI